MKDSLKRGREGLGLAEDTCSPGLGLWTSASVATPVSRSLQEKEMCDHHTFDQDPLCPRDPGLSQKRALMSQYGPQD